MPSPPVPDFAARRSVGWGVPAAPTDLLAIALALASIVTLAAAEGPVAASESLFLAALGASPLLALVGSRGRLPVAPIAGFVYAALLWLLPAGGSRLAAASALLLGCLALGLHDLVRNPQPPGPAVLRWGLWLLGVRVLWRPDLLAPLPTGQALWDLVWPVLLLTWAMRVLVARRSTAQALLAAGSVCLLAGGPTRTAALILVLLAASEGLAGTLRPLTEGATAPAEARGGRDWRLWLYLGALVAPGIWQTRLAVVGVVATAAMLLPRRWSWLLAPTVALAAWLLVPTVLGRMPLGFLWLLPLLLPLGLLPRALPVTDLLTGLGLAGLGFHLFPGVGGVALAAGWTTLRLDREARGWQLQAAWTGGAMLWASLLAALPWSRPRPLLSLLELLGLSPTFASSVALGATFALATWWLHRSLPSAPLRALRAPELAAGVLLAAALIQIERPLPHAIDGPPFQLDHLQPATIVSVTPTQNGALRLAIDSTTSHSSLLTPGTTIAFVDLLDDRDSSVERLVLRLGRDTGDWSGAGPRPEAVRVRIGPDGRRYHLYRKRWPDQEGVAPVQISRVRVARAPQLPPGVVLVVDRIEVAP